MKGQHIYGVGGAEHWYIDGEVATQAEFEAAFPDRPLGNGRGLCGWKPIVSDALAVHPDQVAEATEHAKKMGVPTDFQPDGRPILTSRSHRRAYLKTYGFHDREGGYGDG